MTAGSKVGYQPKPLLPSDYKEFLKYRQATNTSIREVFYQPTERFKVIQTNSQNPKKTRKIKKI